VDDTPSLPKLKIQDAGRHAIDIRSN
jgi:hypothetical protein